MNKVSVHKLPAPYCRPVRKMYRRILEHYPNTSAFVVIGSVAMGSWEKDSDVDLVWVLSGRRRKTWREELDYHYEGVVELVPLSLSDLERHFAQRSSLAHAIHCGIVLFDPRGLIGCLQRKPLGPPSREWMEEWFEFFRRRLDGGLETYRMARDFHRRSCKGECFCSVSEVLTRAVVNLVRVLLATEGLVPNSKAEMRRCYPDMIRGPRLRKAMEIALRAHHEKRDLGLDEAAEVSRLGLWARARLVGILGKGDGTKVNGEPKRS